MGRRGEPSEALTEIRAFIRQSLAHASLEAQVAELQQRRDKSKLALSQLEPRARGALGRLLPGEQPGSRPLVIDGQVVAIDKRSGALELVGEGIITEAELAESMSGATVD